jgi:hypothetical protein
MALIDSKETPLPAPEVILESVKNSNDTGYPPAVVATAIVKEMTMKGVDMVQIGNTVFIGHRGKGENKDKMVGRAFNVDTGENFIRNGFKYFNYLQGKGITRYVTQYDGDIFDSAFRTFYRRIKTSDSKFTMAKTRQGKTIVGIKLGKEPHKEGVI